MHPLAAIIIFGLAMSTIALSGSLTLFCRESTLQRLTQPLVALASGSLIGGAMFHLMPAAVDSLGNTIPVYISLVAGFVVFQILEQILHWHHCHRTVSRHTHPMGVMILIADGLHNCIGGVSIGALFVSDFRLGLTAWAAAAVHEVPQELGDFGILIHSGWRKGRALLFNFLSGLTFLLGGVLAYLVSSSVSIDWLIPFAAGNFLYIGAVDLVPEFKNAQGKCPLILSTAVFLFGLVLVLSVRLLLKG
ncbi:MAG: ZIP family metal transporter [Desulfohalobiaceae bacterium]|jgi:zinc and cadmium transporter|nr:ZIP family metal transporter [Desulfohalobiaceae bacterium]